MNAGIRLILRTASICLLGFTEIVPLAASPRHAAPISAASSILAHPRPQETLAAPFNSLTRRSTRRTFVENTTSPSSEALKTVRLQSPAKLDSPPFPGPPILRNASASVANRQRAP